VYFTFLPITTPLSSYFGFVLNFGVIWSGFMLYFLIILTLKRSIPCSGHLSSIQMFGVFSPPLLD